MTNINISIDYNGNNFKTDYRLGDERFINARVRLPDNATSEEVINNIFSNHILPSLWEMRNIMIEKYKELK